MKKAAKLLALGLALVGIWAVAARCAGSNAEINNNGQGATKNDCDNYRQTYNEYQRSGSGSGWEAVHYQKSAELIRVKALGAGCPGFSERSATSERHTSVNSASDKCATYKREYDRYKLEEWSANSRYRNWEMGVRNKGASTSPSVRAEANRYKRDADYYRRQKEDEARKAREEGCTVYWW